jgi:hypothetical protein
VFGEKTGGYIVFDHSADRFHHPRSSQVVRPLLPVIGFPRSTRTEAEPCSIRPPVTTACVLTVPMPLHRDREPVGSGQSTAVSRAGEIACAIGRCELRTRSPGTSASSFATEAESSDVECCSRQVLISPSSRMTHLRDVAAAVRNCR